MASASIKSAMESAVVAGGIQSSSLSPRMQQRVLGTVDEWAPWFPASHPSTPDAPAMDMSIAVGWNTAKAAGIAREEMDAWAYRSHMRAVEAIDAGRFVDEIMPVKVSAPDGSLVEFAVDEHPRRGTTMEKLA
jgi:acetyl-CoA C-acetyltransferase